MRLLNTSTIKLHEFQGDAIPEYAILSHTWEDDEVLFRDVETGTAKTRRGYRKVRACCKLARTDGWEYIWIDSACIDKSSSAELSEAINSMFTWYQNAEVCYAFLADVVSSEHDSIDRLHGELRLSRWFTRGWTLQELLAPSSVLFYNSQWVEIGTKNSLSQVVQSITGIEKAELRGDFRGASVARKMSWASRRKTTRVEDSAYCLLGLFDVQMPLLYGEGEKAFTRLQLQIISVNDDESIFAWDDVNPNPGILASSPIGFLRSGAVVIWKWDQERRPYDMTNKGLRMDVLMKLYGDTECIVPLNCQWKSEWEDFPPIMVELTKVDDVFQRKTIYNIGTITAPDSTLRSFPTESHNFQRSTIYIQPYLPVDIIRLKDRERLRASSWLCVIKHSPTLSVFKSGLFLPCWSEGPEDFIDPHQMPSGELAVSVPRGRIVGAEWSLPHPRPHGAKNFALTLLPPETLPGGARSQPIFDLVLLDTEEKLSDTVYKFRDTLTKEINIPELRSRAEVGRLIAMGRERMSQPLASRYVVSATLKPLPKQSLQGRSMSAGKGSDKKFSGFVVDVRVYPAPALPGPDPWAHLKPYRSLQSRASEVLANLDSS